ncbi:MAG TPA: Lrp/AsnC family transcriptional regulator [Thermoplasmatales archaeon]|nr:Lrp/AsnC family transcriptional regulator [Thermoplasmatales archaeon]
MIDKIDERILEILQKNARTPYTQIAKEVGLSEGAIRKRIEALEKKGVIKKYVAIIDPKKIGYNSITLLGIDTEPTKLLEIANEISKLKEAKNVYLSTGDHMIMAEIWAKDGKELSNILANKIAKIEGVKRICPAIILEKLKEG